MRPVFGVRAVLILLVLISVLPVFVVLVRISISEQDSALDKARLGLANQVQLRSNSQEKLLAGVRHLLTVLAHGAPLRSANAGDCDRYLQELSQHFPQYAHLGFADAAGNLVCRSALDPRPLNLGDRQYFKDALRTGAFTVSEFIVSRILGRPAIAFGLPGHLPGGGIHGVQYAILDVSGIQQEFGSLSVPAEITEVITDPSGVVLAWGGQRLASVGERLPEGFLLSAIQARRPALGAARDDRGEEWLYAARFVGAEGGGGVVVAAMMSTASVLRPAIERLWLGIAILLAITLAASWLAWRLGDRLLARPVERLLSALKALERDEVLAASRAAPPLVDELRQMHRSIDDLSIALAARSRQRDAALSELQEQKKSLERSEERYRVQFEASPQPMWVFDISTLAFLVVNDAAVAHYGYSREEFMRMTLADIRPPEDLPLLLESIEKAGPEPQNLVLRRHWCKNGETIEVEIATHPVTWEGRQARATIVYDVTSREAARRAWHSLHQTLEQRVVRRTRDLALANEELEAFSYSVSHDLRTPLHVIEGFCEALVERHGAALPDQARHYLSRIRAGTLQMNTLIADLLSFARTGRAPVVARRTDLAPLAAGVVARLRQRFPERAVEVHIQQPLPAVCDPNLVTIVLENLIGNAWKFSAGRADAAIRIERAESADSECTYVVSDNGAGFDMAYVDKLFKPFQRLHSADEFEGTGVGLAIVARIVRRHGGQFRAESAPGQGARFCFSLPAGPVSAGGSMASSGPMPLADPVS